jgi:hypothetical protein
VCRNRAALASGGAGYEIHRHCRRRPALPLTRISQHRRGLWGVSARLYITAFNEATKRAAKRSAAMTLLGEIYARLGVGYDDSGRR